MKLHQYSNVETFLKKTEPILLKQEAVNNLPLGILYRLRQDPHAFGKSEPFLAAVEENEKIRLVMVMTPPKNLIIYGEGDKLSEVIQTAVHELTEKKIEVPGVIGPRKITEQFAESWAKRHGVDPVVNMEQRIYKLEKVNDVPRSPGQMRVANEKDLSFVSKWVQKFAETAMEPMTEEEAYEHAEKTIEEGSLYLWEYEGQPVSMAKQSRPSKNGTVVSLVYTPPELQGRGYATTCVAELSQLLLNKGYKFCSLYTDLANPTSNSIYMKIGYEPIEDSIVYNF